ncbi:MAG: thioredoxin [Elusimicrobiales bacterium]|nr:thioredoxin [Elusimicrobiales bacterium]
MSAAFRYFNQQARQNMSNEIQLTDANFEAEVVKSDKPVLVDFWAPWCGPCRMIGPVIEQLAAEYAGKVKVCKLNTDEAQDTAGKYQISAIPTILLFKDGQVKHQLVGLQPKEELKKYLDELLG